MNRIALLLAVMLCAAPTGASDRLDPEDSDFAIKSDWARHYDTIVLAVLKPILAPDVRIRMIAVPSFRAEYAVGLAGGNGNWRIVGVEPAIHLWMYEVMDKDTLAAKGIPSDWHDVAVTQCDQAIAAPLAERLLNLWKTMLENSGYPKAPPLHLTPDGKLPLETVSIREDGDVFHFAMARYPDMTAKAWSPAPDTAPGMLVAIADTMRDYCKRKDGRLLDRLESQIGNLEDRLR